jgi:hypothetical protein
MRVRLLGNVYVVVILFTVVYLSASRCTGGDLLMYDKM